MLTPIIIHQTAGYLFRFQMESSHSGTDSIEWYHRWVETGDPDIRQHILEYNEDDCRATRVLLDGIKKLRFLS